VIFLHRDNDVIHLRETAHAGFSSARVLRADSDRENRTHNYTDDISLHGFLRRAGADVAFPQRAQGLRALYWKTPGYLKATGGR
jgi:hypothetical protein